MQIRSICYQRTVTFNNGKTSILISLVFFSLICANCGCSALNGSGSTDDDASSADMMDPNMINPPNKQGYGKNIPTSKQGSMNAILVFF